MQSRENAKNVLALLLTAFAFAPSSAFGFIDSYKRFNFKFESASPFEESAPAGTENYTLT